MNAGTDSPDFNYEELGGLLIILLHLGVDMKLKGNLVVNTVSVGKLSILRPLAAVAGRGREG